MRLQRLTQLQWLPLSLLATLLVVLQIGCACTGVRDYPPLCEAQFERGEPCDVVDIAGSVLSIPSKILLWNKRVDSHCISLQTEDAIENFVVSNGLDSTKVRFNQYDPMGEWKRLGRNKGVPPLMRFTFGTAKTLGYTLVPGRLFGGDNYNPYTDTLNVYSDVPALGMAEAAFAKNVRSRQHRGWYLFGQELPIIGMHHEGQATTDVLDYLAINGDPQAQREGYEVLYPRYGGAWGSTVGDIFTNGNPVGLVAGTVVGHVAGRQKSSQIAAVNYEVPASHQIQQSYPITDPTQYPSPQPSPYPTPHPNAYPATFGSHHPNALPMAAPTVRGQQ